MSVCKCMYSVRKGLYMYLKILLSISKRNRNRGKWKTLLVNSVCACVNVCTVYLPFVICASVCISGVCSNRIKGHKSEHFSWFRAPSALPNRLGDHSHCPISNQPLHILVFIFGISNCSSACPSSPIPQVSYQNGRP